MTTEKPFYRPDELAEALRIPLSTVRWWISNGTVGTIKVGKHRRIPSDEFARIVTRGTLTTVSNR